MAQNLMTVFGGRSATSSATQTRPNLMLKKEAFTSDVGSITNENERHILKVLIADSGPAERSYLCSQVAAYTGRNKYVPARLLGATTGGGISKMFDAFKAAGIKGFVPSELTIWMLPEGLEVAQNILVYGSIEQIRALAKWALAQRAITKNVEAQNAAAGVYERATNIAGLLEMLKNGKSLPACDTFKSLTAGFIPVG